MPNTDGDDPTVAQLKADIKQAKGTMLTVESMADSWQTDGPRAQRDNWQAKRFGATPPDAMINLAELASNEVYTACGLSPALFSQRGDGTAQREAWRRALFGVMQPLGKIVSEELAEKLDSPALALDWQELRASDLASRARSFKQMIEAGMDTDKAAALSGLLLPTE